MQTIIIEEQDLDLALKVLPNRSKSICENCLVAQAVKRQITCFLRFNGVSISLVGITNRKLIVPQKITILSNEFDINWRFPNSPKIQEIRESLPIQFEAQFIK